MVELRKRKTPPPPAPVAKKEKKAATPKTKAASKGKTAEDAPAPAAPEPSEESATMEHAPEPSSSKAAAKSGPPKTGDSIDLADFGGEVETHDGKKVTLSTLVDESEAGVVLFTYPSYYTALSSTGFSIYGLSNDTPKANTTFKTKQSLPYTLLCDKSATLISAIGLGKSPSGTVRGVFVVDKAGKVLAAEPGGPAPTVEVVKKLVESKGGSKEGLEKAEKAAKEGEGEGDENMEAANTAAEVADTAAKVDKDV
ncbi:thioredoxin peroxidase dot5 [Elasticomyces elasticus]|nr:thioredoxin peroxidase dot5 [Elasticomyces elasticus]